MTTGTISSAGASVLLLLIKMTKATKTPGDQLRTPREGGRRKGRRPGFDHACFLPDTVREHEEA